MKGIDVDSTIAHTMDDVLNAVSGQHVKLSAAHNASINDQSCMQAKCASQLNVISSHVKMRNHHKASTYTKRHSD